MRIHLFATLSVWNPASPSNRASGLDLESFVVLLALLAFNLFRVSVELLPTRPTFLCSFGLCENHYHLLLMFDIDN